MTLRMLFAVLAAGCVLLGSDGARTQTNEPTTPEAASPPAAAAPSDTGEAPAGQEQPPAANGGTPPAATEQPGAEEVPPVEVIQPKPKPTPEPEPVVEPKPKPKPAPVVATTPPLPRVTTPKPAEPQDFADKIAPIGAETQGSVMSATTSVPMSPVQGATIPLAKVPSGVSVLSGTDFGRVGYTDTFQDVLAQRVPDVIISDLQGNEFQTNIQFRGFEASPVNGVPQGLAVYQNGVRINESFGDTVNWDFLPEIAIDNLAVVSNNPVFGLNALGGAIVVNMKSGFTYQGGEITFDAGSFGRAEGGAQAGVRAGNWGHAARVRHWLLQLPLFSLRKTRTMRMGARPRRRKKKKE